MEQLESYWCTGVMALVQNGWVCPTVLDFLDEEEEEEDLDEEEEDLDEEEEDDDSESPLLDCNADYYRTGGWTASASRADVPDRAVEYKLRLGLPQDVAVLMQQDIGNLGEFPGEYIKHLPKLMAFVNKFFSQEIGKGSAVAAPTGTTLSFERDSVRLVVELTSQATSKC